MHALGSVTGKRKQTNIFGRIKNEEIAGIYKDILLVRASDDFVYDIGQDGGLVSSILIWCLENKLLMELSYQVLKALKEVTQVGGYPHGSY